MQRSFFKDDRDEYEGMLDSSCAENVKRSVEAVLTSNNMGRLAAVLRPGMSRFLNKNQ